MFHLKLIMLAALLSVACAHPGRLRAEERVVTLQDLVAAAMQRNGNLMALREERGIGEAGRIRSALRPNPTLDLEAESGAFTGSSSEHRVSLGVSQEFLTGGKRDKRIAVARSELDRYERQIKEAERLLLLEVKQGYYDLLLAQGRVGLAQRHQGLSRRLLEIAQERFAAGEVAEIEVNLARVEAARSAAGKIEAERDLVPVRRRLLSLIGAPPSQSLQVAAAAEPTPYRGDLAGVKALALEKRPDLQLLRSELAKGEAEVSLAVAERLPNLTAGIALALEKSATELGDLREKETEYLVGLRLSAPIPLFDRNQAGVREARARKSGSETRYQFARQNAEREIEAALAGLAASDEALRLYAAEVIPGMTENLDLVQQAYQYGEIDLLEVIEEQGKFAEASRSHLSALHQRQMAQAQLEAALGIEFSESDGGRR